VRDGFERLLLVFMITVGGHIYYLYKFVTQGINLLLKVLKPFFLLLSSHHSLLCPQQNPIRNVYYMCSNSKYITREIRYGLQKHI
jgi:hypothetical protein